jgi:hypothetical protein
MLPPQSQKLSLAKSKKMTVHPALTLFEISSLSKHDVFNFS